MYNQMQNQMNPQVNPAEGFNTPTNHTNTTPKQRPTIIFDDEVKEILENSYDEMINGMINLAIKRFAETKEYKEYFVKKEFRESIEIKEEILGPSQEEATSQIMASPAHTSQTSQSIPESSSGISAVSAW